MYSQALEIMKRMLFSRPTRAQLIVCQMKRRSGRSDILSLDTRYNNLQKTTAFIPLYCNYPTLTCQINYKTWCDLH